MTTTQSYKITKKYNGVNIDEFKYRDRINDCIVRQGSEPGQYRVSCAHGDSRVGPCGKYTVDWRTGRSTINDIWFTPKESGIYPNWDLIKIRLAKDGTDTWLQP